MSDLYMLMTDTRHGSLSLMPHSLIQRGVRRDGIITAC